jgi:hypothetical protein
MKILLYAVFWGVFFAGIALYALTSYLAIIFGALVICFACSFGIESLSEEETDHNLSVR